MREARKAYEFSLKNILTRNYPKNQFILLNLQQTRSIHLPTPLLIIDNHWYMKAFFDKHELPGMGLLAVASFSRTSCSISSNTCVKYGRLVQLRAISKAWTPRLQWKKTWKWSIQKQHSKDVETIREDTTKHANVELIHWICKYN